MESLCSVLERKSFALCRAPPCLPISDERKVFVGMFLKSVSLEF